MKNFARFLALGWLVVVTSGCIETSDVYTLNPDGSGKVDHEVVLTPMGFGPGGDDDPEANARHALRQMLEESDGVEAWSGAGFEVLDDGRMRLRGTAYFRDANKLIISNGGMKSSSPEVEVQMPEAGSMVVTVALGDSKAKDDTGDGPPAGELSEEEFIRQKEKLMR